MGTMEWDMKDLKFPNFEKAQADIRILISEKTGNT